MDVNHNFTECVVYRINVALYVSGLMTGLFCDTKHVTGLVITKNGILSGKAYKTI